MRLPFFPKSEIIKETWWHKLTNDASIVLFALSIIISILIVQNYISKTFEVKRINKIAEKVELPGILKDIPGKNQYYLQEFGGLVKDQYPELSEFGNKDLALAILHKYPRYRALSYYSESYFKVRTYLLWYIPPLIIGGFFLPNIIYRIVLYSFFENKWKDPS